MELTGFSGFVKFFCSMTMNPLPPQAYTKDALLKAYAWLMNQPQSIKELASTPDVLVSLYLKAQRDGIESLDRPSIQNFRSELKQLAGMMNDLTEKTHNNNGVHPDAEKMAKQSQTGAPHLGASSPAEFYTPKTDRLGNAPLAPSSATHVSMNHQPISTSMANQNRSQSTVNSSVPPTFIPPAQADISTLQFDSKSLEMIREVKELLNVSNENEALRALIKIGFQTLSTKIFEKK